MAESAIRDYAKTRGFHRQTLDRWLGWEVSDQSALAEIAIGLKISENHLRDLMDWLEETSLRDGSTIAAILTHPAIGAIATDPRLGRADKLKRVKEQIRRWRFPRLAAIEKSIDGRIQALKLPTEIQVKVPPGLEGSRVHVTFSAGTRDEFEKLTNRLSNAATSGIIVEIFQLLSGEFSETDPRQN
jgi:hypothetical protein